MIEGQLNNWCLAKSLFGVNEIERGDGSGEKIFDDVLTSEPVNTYECYIFFEGQHYFK